MLLCGFLLDKAQPLLICYTISTLISMFLYYWDRYNIYDMFRISLFILRRPSQKDLLYFINDWLLCRLHNWKGIRMSIKNSNKRAFQILCQLRAPSIDFLLVLVFDLHVIYINENLSSKESLFNLRNKQLFQKLSGIRT